MAFKMKAGPGGPMKKNFPSVFKQGKEHRLKSGSIDMQGEVGGKEPKVTEKKFLGRTRKKTKYYDPVTGKRIGKKITTTKKSGESKDLLVRRGSFMGAQIGQKYKDPTTLMSQEAIHGKGFDDKGEKRWRILGSKKMFKKHLEY